MVSDTNWWAKLVSRWLRQTLVVRFKKTAGGMNLPAVFYFTGSF
jgi:hypothetical protein